MNHKQKILTYGIVVCLVIVTIIGASAKDVNEKSGWESFYEVITDWFTSEQPTDVYIVEVQTNTTTYWDEQIPIKQWNRSCRWANDSGMGCNQIIGFETNRQTKVTVGEIVQHLRTVRDDVVRSDLWCYTDSDNHVVCLSLRDCQNAISHERRYSQGCTRCLPRTDPVTDKIVFDCRGSNQIIGTIISGERR
jgi:hypothetical protein